MKSLKIFSGCIMLAAILVLIPIHGLEAQRMSHGGGNRGGGFRSSPGMSRPAQQPRSSPQTRPAQQPRSSTPSTRPAQQPKQSINGGAQKDANRNMSAKNPSSRPSTGTRDVNKSDLKGNKGDYNRNNSNISNNRSNVNVNNRNVNIHQTNVYVRPPVRPYPRPPYAYGGFHYYAYHPYHYHPYHPFYWGPMWHPWGFFVATMTATAIIISIENQKYYYDQGNYYVEGNGGYTVVEAPPGATIQVLPDGAETVVVNETTNNYYYGGTYYEKTDEGYTVVPPTAGTLVPDLPEGGEEVKIGDVTYVKLGDIYYQPVEVDGKNMYEVVNVEPAED